MIDAEPTKDLMAKETCYRLIFASDGPHLKPILMTGKAFPVSPLRLLSDFMSVESVLVSNVSVSDVTTVNK